MFWLLVLGFVILVVLGILVLAAVRASRSQPAQVESTPTQQTGNPYRRFYDYKKK
ncbi:hypothetical protein [uncultured Ruthenibacterium sp.]|uniref:hypothetical protein n=1 Tax=uncultured Ruthenibacterium sp. TaxID=1905347 RepID=UPI00349EED62